MQLINKKYQSSKCKATTIVTTFTRLAISKQVEVYGWVISRAQRISDFIEKRAFKLSLLPVLGCRFLSLIQSSTNYIRFTIAHPKISKGKPYLN
jgi:hypothetical protein